MNDDQRSIHDFEFQLICDYFIGLDRQGPGSPDLTVKALGFIDGLHEGSRIADIGCGTGTQTITLARNTKGSITAIDLFAPFIDILDDKIMRLGLQDRMTTLVGSMEQLPFERDSMDLLWAEGSIYNIGFERGINEWRRFLKTGGYIAITEASWFTNERPEEIDAFWNDAYPEIDVISAKVRQMEQAGYVPVSTFAIPTSCWTDYFYAEADKAAASFLDKHGHCREAVDFVANQRHEQELYHRYKDFYGYVFYIGRKI